MRFDLILTILIVGFTEARFADELIVAVGNQLEVITGGFKHEHISLGGYNASLLVALSFNPELQQLYFSDLHHHTANIFSVNLGVDPPQRTVHALDQKEGGETVEGLTFVPSEHVLLWTDGSRQLIRQIHVSGNTSSDETQTKIELVHSLAGGRPRSLVADPCTKMLYWANLNKENSTIEGSYLNGSNRHIIISDNLVLPHGLALDVENQQLYWASNLRYSSFRIERSYVDGSERQVVYKGVGQFIFGLTVGERQIYWTDWQQQTLWSLSKELSNDKPLALRRYSHKPMSVIVLSKEPINCEIITKETQQNLQPVVPKEPDYDHGLVSYQMVNDINSCLNYCMDNGKCVEFDGNVMCRCFEGYIGDRCQDKLEINNTQCSYMSVILGNVNGETIVIAIFVVSSVCLALFVVVIILSIRLCQLKKRPRLRRRFFGTSKGKLSTPGPVIDIENCCNMNLCETPCIDPVNRTPHTKGSKDEDKEKLINSREILDE